MKKKIKLILFIIVLISLISLFMYLKLRTYSYEEEYTVDEYKIKEMYDKKNSIYTLYITKNEIIYPYKINNKFLREKKIINKVNIYNNDNEICILPISEYLNFYPLCYDEKLFTYNLSDNNIDDYQYKKVKDKSVTYDKVDINYLNNNNYLLYNYKGFDFINEDGIKNIELFTKDSYTINLVYEYEHYLIVADYNDKYYFNKFYLVNMKNGDYEEIDIGKEISFDSVFLGHFKNNVYILDKKEEKEYKINVKKKKVEETQFVILKNNKLESTSFKEIINNNLLFENDNECFYKIIDNKLYQVIDEFKILISDMEVDKIIKEDKDTIYYLSSDKLYMYNNIYGEVLLMSNFEWNFNNTNMIYLYK